MKSKTNYSFYRLIRALRPLCAVVLCALSLAACSPATPASSGADPLDEPTPPPDSLQTIEPAPTPTPAGAFIPIEPVEASGSIAGAEREDASQAAIPLDYSLRVPNINDPRAAALNDEYAETLRYYQDDFAPMFAEDAASLLENPDASQTLELYFDYDVKYNDGKIISILFVEGTLVGDQYGETYYAETYSFDEGRALTLEDVISSGESAYEAAAKEIARQIDEARRSDDPWGYYENVDENAVAMYLSDTSFYLNADGAVVLILNPAFISPCVSGVCEFIMHK
ncbi:MAG: hypothetical protein LBS72_07160 [Oscillospiraceae bacterium]|jgi:hypothetical protein|nr:hypothetical protein [Oscillospiraceae bacterium]